MAKAYWVATYRSISDPDKLAAYAKLAGQSLTANRKAMATQNVDKIEEGIARLGKAL